MRLALRRIAAYLVDYLVILIWVALLFGAATLGWIGLKDPDVWTSITRWTAQGQAFLMMTFPVWLYFTISEAFGAKATLGKRLLGLSVEGSPGRVAIRNALKFLPWEIAHAGIWHGMPRPLSSDPSMLGWVLLIGAMVLAAIWGLSLLIGGDRAIYDRITGTRVGMTERP